MMKMLSRRGLIAGLGSSLLLPRLTFAADDAAPPVPISLPEDDGPHDAVTEWWYYTGHVETAKGRLFGFEQVTFKGRRGALAGYASHVAVTDGERQLFTYDQRAVLDDGSIAKPGDGFDLAIGDWSMRGLDGRDFLTMVLPAYGYTLELTSRKPPVLHGGDGYVKAGSGAESYYYSRTRMVVSGMLNVDGIDSAVTGDAWMDHQWGSFTSFSEGGWDWFSIQLDDDSEVMIYQLRDAGGVPSLGVATYVDAEGLAEDLQSADVVVEVDDTWVSPHSGATYPMAWSLHVSRQALTLRLRPVMEDQELDTRQTTRVTYWEGQVEVTGSRAGKPVGGRGYVELTGYTRERDGIVP
jgi:predicted secreted hydrolase